MNSRISSGDCAISASRSRIVGELGPALGLNEEPVERADRGLVLGIDFDDAPVARDGVVDVLELDLEDLRGAQAELHERSAGFSASLSSSAS